MARLRLLTYNVKLLPDLARTSMQDPQPFVRGDSHRFTGGWWERWMTDGERTGRLAQAIAAGGYDLVCLQEVFDEDRRAQLVRGLRAGGYRHFVAYSGDDDLLHEDSGLFFASKLPIRWSHFEEYVDAANEDAWADKGVSCVAVDAGAALASTTLLVFNTHLQAHDSKASREARAGQLAQLGRKIERVTAKLRDPATCAMVVCGDFNVAAEREVEGALAATPEYRRLTRALKHGRDLFRSKNPRAGGFTSGGLLTRKMTRGAPGPRKRLDYVFALDRVPVSGRQPPLIDLRRLACKRASVERFYDAEKRGNLSDHLGVTVELALPARRRPSG